MKKWEYIILYNKIYYIKDIFVNIKTKEKDLVLLWICWDIHLKDFNTVSVQCCKAKIFQKIFFILLNKILW